jgi:hypothetical protein
MKKVILTTITLFITLLSYAQAPEKMSYQAVVRDGSDNLVTSSSVGMQLSILQGSASGTAVYVETQTPTSNANGLVSVEIGEGTVVSGDFATIDWANGPYFIKTETDPTGGTNYTVTGTSQLLSVPYALHAKSAESVTGTITETDPIFGASVANGITVTDTAYWNDKLDNYTETDPVFGASAANGITATDISNWNQDIDPSNEIQTLTIDDDTLFISDGNNVTLEGLNYWSKEANSIYAENDELVFGDVNIPTIGNYQARTTIMQFDGSKNQGIRVINNSDAYGGSNPISGSLNIAQGSSNVNHIGSLGQANSSGTGQSFGIAGEATGNGAGARTGVSGLAIGSGADDYTGVVGNSNGDGLRNYGVIGNTNGTSGLNIGTAGFGRATAGDANVGVYGEPLETGANLTYGVWGANNLSQTSDYNTGVHGTASNNTEDNYGVDGTANSTVGNNYGTTGWAWGTTSGNNYGLYGFVNNSTTTNVAVFGKVNGLTAPINYAGYFKGADVGVEDGDVYVTNSLNGVILTSPDNQCWRVTVDNTGAISTSSVACPSVVVE